MENCVKEDLYKYLRSVGELDERMPECPDVADAWRKIAEAYLPDGIREFSGYPMVSLGWMMFLGMAIAQFWDENWTEYGQNTNIYEMLRDKRGYDNMDEYILEEVLRLDAEKRRQTSQLVGECASRTLAILRNSDIEAGTEDAFRGYVACLRQMYLYGAAVQLNRLGYHMTLIYKIPCSGVISRPAASTSCRSFFITSAGIHLRSTLTVRTRLRLRTMSIGA